METSLNHKQQLLLETVRKLLRRGASTNLDRILTRRRPVEIASLFSHLNDYEARNLLTRLLEHDVALAAQVLAEMASTVAEHCLSDLSTEHLIQVVSAIPSDDAAQLLRLLPEETAAEVVTALKGDISEGVEEILGHGEETAGGLMSTDYFALPDTSTVGEAIAALQKAGDSLEMAFYIYIVSESEQLVGVLSLRSLLTTPPETVLKDIMIHEVLAAPTDTDQEEVARMVARYNLLALPVVDNFNKLVGIITVDDVIDIIREEATEDILKMAGAGEEEIGERSILRSVKTRAPWVLTTMVAGMVAAEIIHGYLAELQQTVLLAGFIPVIVGLSGNVGNQSAGVIARGLSMARIDAKLLGRYIFRELRVGVLLGLACGIILTGYIMLRFGEPLMLGPAVGISATLSIITSVAFGGLSPLLLHRIQIDPSFATGPFVSTVVDILGIFIYFAAATTLLNLIGT